MLISFSIVTNNFVNIQTRNIFQVGCNDPDVKQSAQPCNRLGT